MVIEFKSEARSDLPLFPWMKWIREVRRRGFRIGTGTGSLGIEQNLQRIKMGG
jgi:hypothetical protein